MTRIDRLRTLLHHKSLEGCFIKGLASIRYLTGFSGEDSLLFIDHKHCQLITDARYTVQATTETASTDCQIIEQQDGLWKAASELELPKQQLGFDGGYFTYDEFAQLSAVVTNRQWQSLSLAQLRRVKDKKELQSLTRAVNISDRAFEALLPELISGMTELEAAAKLEYKMRLFGSEGVAFPTIVASGERSALPHGTATQKPLTNGDFVTFDFGAVYEGYHSDITRTVVMGKAANWQHDIYRTVLAAQLLGCRSARAGLTGKQLDTIVRDYISQAGYGQYFGHGLGHGVGLEIHEEPVVSKRGESELEAQSVITIEPGIYIPGKGGVRIEDTVVLTNTGCQILTGVSKQLLEII
ncbi:MAG: aminopeptidase P family protein [Acidaminococcaceae bacterium]